jgi:flagellar protein FlaI
MGEVRGEEGRTLFQIMSTGHTTLTTFHADSVGEVLKRFTTDPINVSKTMFTGLDIVSIQTQTRVHGRKVRRNKSITEVNHYDAENDEINVRDIFEWQAESDEFLQLGRSNTLQEIQFDNGWDRERLDDELFKRKVVLAYLVDGGLNDYSEVAATLQAFINDPDTILTLMARDQLEKSLDDLREMESVLIDVNPEKEALVPRPEPTQETKELASSILDDAQERLFDEYAHRQPSELVSALPDVEKSDAIVARPDDGDGSTPGDSDTTDDTTDTTSSDAGDTDLERTE